MLREWTNTSQLIYHIGQPIWTLPFMSILKVDWRILNVVWMEGNNSMWSKRCKLEEKKGCSWHKEEVVLTYSVMMDVRGRGRCWVIVLSLWGGFTSICVLQRAGNILLMKFCKYLFGDIMVAVNSCIKSRSSFKYSLKWNALPLLSLWSNAIKSYITSHILLKLKRLKRCPNSKKSCISEERYK